MVSIHQDFGFDDGDQTCFLAEGGKPCQGVRVGLEATRRWNMFANLKYRPPFAEFGPQLTILGEALRHPIQPFGHLFAWKAAKSFSAFIYVDAGNTAL